LVGCSGLNCAVWKKCWARYQAKRRKQKCLACYNFTPHSHLERLDQPLQIKTSKRIGLCFSADIFDKDFVGSFELEQVVNKVKEAYWHWFINLTKQPHNIPPQLPFPKNWIQGVSVNKVEDLERIKILKRTHAKHLAVSFEPLYEDLGKVELSDIDWVIIGAQTHPLIKPKDEWVENLIAQARFYKCSVFVKNNIPEWNLKEYPAFLEVPTLA
jgi:protein gp37